MTDEDILEVVLDLWAGLCPYGTKPEEYESVARVAIGTVRIHMARTKELVYFNGTAYWRDKQTGAIDTDMGDGCREAAKAGRVNINIGTARPQPGDLKPSESLIRSQRQIQLDSEERARQEKRDSLMRQLRDLDNGALDVHPDAGLNTDNVTVTEESGKRIILPRERVPENVMARQEAEKQQKLARAYESSQRQYENKAIESYAPTPDAPVDVGDRPDPNAAPAKRDRVVEISDFLSPHNPGIRKGL